MVPPSGSGPSPWWRHVPRRDRHGRRLGLFALKLRHQLFRRSTGVALAVAAYGGFCLALVRVGGLLALFALVPLLLLPLLGGIAYWLLWQDYHR